ncbi:TIGR03749 family integrating conjugative element protein [Legionella longbeachae]|uniref:TIGR03749 family integrating conjugative element protein n=1 Tax=Legionella longbeachae TaxID=450 RepID=UPI0009B7BF4C|nr:TIGR03749 family integrating conjugative element protein [Legionella longbeachae]ARB90758.1 TIGR03749 family integrating conjugative element protein [Legionella longbeachae]RZV22667.1 TIGR03749 family integrating conjugative element protein [Legionella longbeachae]UAK46042.1 TIGR03749 family integrating conjugative element protein [Legionella longbeachae]VEE03013.1 integrating conjugative element protein, PFL_4704 family [Legionella oakridgensis]
MKKFKRLLALMSMTCSIQSFALDAEHVLWDKTPIPLDLSLSEERLVHFPQAISIVDNEAGNKIAVLKVQDTLYLKGKDAFENKRLLVQLMPQGEVIILNLTVKEKVVAGKPVEILLDSKEETATQESANTFDVNAITLTRFAIQSLYAPQRLLVIPEGIGRTPMQTRRQINLFYGASIEARPLISWHGGTFYVTAVELKNLLNKEVIVDPRRMVGNWQTATFYPSNTLAARGKEDTTTVFLVSDRPFSTALANSREYVR